MADPWGSWAFQMAGDEKVKREIASLMDVTERKARAHLRSTFLKLNLSGRFRLALALFLHNYERRIPP